MPDLESLIPDEAMRRNVVQSLIVIVGILTARLVLGRLLIGLSFRSEAQRLQWNSRMRLATFLALVVGLVGVWSTQLETVALSAVAFAAAMVIATKELILCVSGSVVRAAGAGFNVGDRIEIAGFRGDVIAHGLLTTTLLEVGPAHRRTGRSVTLPNALFVNTAVINESFHRAYVLHTFAVPIAEGVDWREAERQVRTAAEQACADFLKAAEEAMTSAAEKHGMSAPTVTPRVLLQLPEAGKPQFLVRVPTPTLDKARTEQAVLHRYLDWERATARPASAGPATETPPAASPASEPPPGAAPAS